MVHLKVYDGQEKVEVLELKEEIIHVGRDPGCGLKLPDPSVSRHHAQIEPKGNFYLIRDYGSTNGTFVNEMLVRLHILSDGDTIRIGKYLIRVDVRHSSENDSTRVRVEKLQIPTLYNRGRNPASAVSATGISELTTDGDQRLVRLYKISQEIGYIDTTEGLLERALDIVLEELEAERGSFLLFPDSTKSGGKNEIGDDNLTRPLPVVVKTRSSARPGPSQDGNSRPAPDPGLEKRGEELVIPQEFLQEACRSGESVEFSRPQGSAFDRPVSCLACPLKGKFAVKGVVYVERGFDRAPFTEEDGQFLTALAGQIAISLVNAQLFAEAAAVQEKIKEIFTSLTDGVLVTDVDFKIVEANTAATVLLDVDDKNLLGESLPELLAKFEVAPAIEVVRASAIRERGIFHVTPRGEARGTKNNSRVLAATITAFPRGCSTPQGFVIILRDRSDSWKMEQLKTRFIENVAHKLRTPLTVIQANLPLLKANNETDSSFNREEILDEIDRNSTLLGRVVDRFVDFTEMDSVASLRSITPDSISLKELIHDVVLATEEEATAKGVSIEEHVPDDLPAIIGYQGRLSKAFSNILDNAVKFSRGGEQVRVEASPDDSCVRVEVSDNGPGIPPTEIESVFYIGHQVDADQTGQVPGAGLGLVLARHIVQEHGGEVTITSPRGNANVGTCVTVLLPQAPVRAVPHLARDRAGEPAVVQSAVTSEKELAQ